MITFVKYFVHGFGLFHKVFILVLVLALGKTQRTGICIKVHCACT